MRRMSVRHWLLVVTGLLVWSVIFMLWMTTPTGCQPPNSQHRVVCTGKALLP